MKGLEIIKLKSSVSALFTAILTGHAKFAHRQGCQWATCVAKKLEVGHIKKGKEKVKWPQSQISHIEIGSA